MNQWKRRLKMYIVGLIILLCNMSGASPSTPTKSSSFTSSKSSSSSKASSSSTSSYSSTRSSPTKSSSFTSRREAHETPKSIAPTKSSSFSSTNTGTSKPSSYQTPSTPTSAVTASTMKANSAGKAYTSKAEAEAAYQREQEAKTSKYTSKPVKTKQANSGYVLDDNDEDDNTEHSTGGTARQRSSYGTDDNTSNVVGALVALALIAEQLDDNRGNNSKVVNSKDSTLGRSAILDTPKAGKATVVASTKEVANQSDDFGLWVLVIFLIVLGVVIIAVMKVSGVI